MKNDHITIAKINSSLGLPKNASYCSTCGIYSLKLLGHKLPKINGFAYSWRQTNRLIFYPQMLRGNLRAIPEIKLMDAVICTWSHVEYVAPEINSYKIKFDFYLRNGQHYGGITTIACNTTGNNRFRREGCYYPIKRYWTQISGVYNHITPYVESINKKSK